MSLKWGEEERLRALDQAIELTASGEVEKAINVILRSIPGSGLLHDPVVETALKAECALEAIRSGSEEEVYSAALDELVVDLAVEHDFERALEIAKLIRGEHDQSDALSFIATSFAEAGQFEDALSTAAEITNPEERTMRLIDIAEQLVLAGESERGLAIARQITDEDFRLQAFEQIGTALIEVDQFEEGLECLKNCGAEGSELWFEASAFLARQLAKRGEFLKAFKTVREIDDDRIRSKALHWIQAELVIRRMLARIEE